MLYLELEISPYSDNRSGRGDGPGSDRGGGRRSSGGGRRRSGRGGSGSRSAASLNLIRPGARVGIQVKEEATGAGVGVDSPSALAIVDTLVEDGAVVRVAVETLSLAQIGRRRRRSSRLRSRRIVSIHFI